MSQNDFKLLEDNALTIGGPTKTTISKIINVIEIISKNKFKNFISRNNPFTLKNLIKSKYLSFINFEEIR